MYGVELYAAVRLAVVDEGLSHHEAGRRFGIDRRTVKKMLSYSAPPGYRRPKPVRRPKLDGFTGIVDAILEADTDPDVPRKQRHTAHRIFERLRDEHGFTGGYTIVKDYVRSGGNRRARPSCRCIKSCVWADHAAARSWRSPSTNLTPRMISARWFDPSSFLHFSERTGIV